MDREQIDKLFREIALRKEKVYNHLNLEQYHKQFRPSHIHDGVYSYIEGTGKSLRPAVLLMSCGAVGGNEENALPAAAAVEMFHTWTLVHDDIIDRDEKRRGRPTVHKDFTERGQNDLGLDDEYAAHYGISIGILAGDCQHGWSISMLTELCKNSNIDPKVALALIRELDWHILNELVEGETLDVQYSKFPIEKVNEEMIVEMLRKKTGILYEFAGKAGAMIGLNTDDMNNSLVKAVSQFTLNCGIAFQLQDDILGIVGSEEKLGKPVGSDIREGKRTTIVLKALQNGTPEEGKKLLSILGKEDASNEEIETATEMLVRLGGIDYTNDLALSYIKKAKEHMKDIPESEYKELLSLWADYMVSREF